MKLFVDCDDTLVIWHDLHLNQDKTLWIRHEWEPNGSLIAAIHIYLETHQDVELIIWSGGGLDYAATWGNRFFPETPHLALSKDITVPTTNDLCVDDSDIAVHSVVMSPTFFTERFGFGG